LWVIKVVRKLFKENTSEVTEYCQVRGEMVLKRPEKREGRGEGERRRTEEVM